MKQTSFTTFSLIADENMFLTQADMNVNIEERVLAKRVDLGKYDSVENWREISAEEAEEISRLKEEYLKELDEEAMAADSMECDDVPCEL